jgi:hypothetical protein
MKASASAADHRGRGGGHMGERAQHRRHDRDEGDRHGEVERVFGRDALPHQRAARVRRYHDGATGTQTPKK